MTRINSRMTFEQMETALANGADPNTRCKIDGSTLLMDASIWGQLDKVQLLLRHGANKTLTFDNSPLFEFLHNPNFKIHNHTAKNRLQIAKKSTYIPNYDEILALL